MRYAVTKHIYFIVLKGIVSDELFTVGISKYTKHNMIHEKQGDKYRIC